MARSSLLLALACCLAVACDTSVTPTPTPSDGQPTPTTSGQPSDGPTPTGQVSPTASPTADPTPTATPVGPTGLEWTAVALPTDPRHAIVGVVDMATRNTEILVAGVGWVEDDKGVLASEVQFWHSTDGATWQLLSGVSWPGGQLEVLTAWQGDWIAGGYIDEDERARAAFWRSSDGVAWERLPDRATFEFFAGATTGRDIVSGGMSDLRVDGDELVATGWLYCACDVSTYEATVIWRTADADTWSRADEPPSDTWQEPIAGGPGWLRVSADGSAIETSADQAAWSIAWSATPDSLGVTPSTQIFALHAVAGGFVAVGTLVDDGIARPLALHSGDGLAWTQSTGWPDIDTLTGTLLEVGGAGDVLVAIGPAGEPHAPHAWWSTVAGE